MEQTVFGPFSVDLAARRLQRGESELILRPQAFRVLNVLILNSGRYVHHEQMIREAWDGISVSPNTVAVTVAEVKKVLQEYDPGFAAGPNWVTAWRCLGVRISSRRGGISGSAERARDSKRHWPVSNRPLKKTMATSGRSKECRFATCCCARMVCVHPTRCIRSFWRRTTGQWLWEA